LRVALSAVLLLAASIAPAKDPSIWEVTPYRVQLLVTLSPSAELTPGVHADLLASLDRRIDVVVQSAWDVEHVAPAADEDRESRQQYETFRRELIAAFAASDGQRIPSPSLAFDKVMRLDVAAADAGYRVAAREFDVRTRRFGSEVVVAAGHLAKLRNAAVDALWQAFAPLAQIDAVAGADVTLKLKAGALQPADPDLQTVRPRDVFLPVVRRDDRSGNPEQITTPPWTFLYVGDVTDEGVTCRLESGLRVALSSRRRGRVQQLALGVVPPKRPTTLTLHARTDFKPTEDEPEPPTPEPLAGYDVYARPPDVKAAVHVGRSDRFGRVEIPPSAGPLRVLVVRNGGQPLAKLPMVPGFEPQMSVELPDDRQRLAAEGVITGLQEQLVDLVTRRGVLILRAEARLTAAAKDRTAGNATSAAKRVTEAEAFIDELIKVQKTRAALDDALSQARRDLRSRDRAVQEKIDVLLADTMQLLAQHLDPQPVEAVRQKLAAAKGL